MKQITTTKTPNSAFSNGFRSFAEAVGPTKGWKKPS